MMILRNYPRIKSRHYEISRLTREEIENTKRFVESAVFQSDLEKLAKGINPESNRKVTIDGPTYCRVNCAYQQKKQVASIDLVSYLNESQENDRKNKEIDIYNDGVVEAIRQIDALSKWEDYVLFENRHYGLPDFVNNVHRTNDCFGNQVKTHYDSCSCSSCENWYGCSNPIGTQHYECDKCDYKTSNTSSVF